MSSRLSQRLGQLLTDSSDSEEERLEPTHAQRKLLKDLIKSAGKDWPEAKTFYNKSTRSEVSRRIDELYVERDPTAVTQRQKDLLANLKYTGPTPTTRLQCSELLEQLLAAKYQQRTAWKDEPVSNLQIKLLKNFGVLDPPETKGEASKLIGLKRQEAKAAKEAGPNTPNPKRLRRLQSEDPSLE